jgi:hypothetical protein
MGAFTSKATGNWASAGQTTWNEAGVPGAGDTVAINAGHVVTATADTTVGDGTATTVLAVTGIGAKLVVSGCKLTIRGNASFGAYNSGDVKLYLDVANSGATPGGIELDGNSGVTPTVSFGYDSMMRIRGVSGTRCFFRTKSGTAGNPGVVNSPGVDRALFLDAAYADFSRLGDASTPGLSAPFLTFWVTGPAGYTHDPFRLDRCAFDACGQIPVATLGYGSPGQVDIDFQLTNCTWTNSVSSDFLCAIAVKSSLAIADGTRLVDRNQFNGLAVSFPAPKDFTITNNYFDDNVVGGGGLNGLWATFDSNFVRDRRGTVERVWGGGSTNSFLLYNPTISDAAGTHLLLVPQGGDSTYDSNVFQAIGSATADHSCIGESEGDTMLRTCTVTKNIMLPGFGRLVQTNSTDAARTNVNGEHHSVINHNTGVVDGTLGLVSCGAQDAHTIDSFRSNIAYRPTVGTGIYLFKNDDTAPVSDVFATSGGLPLADYNGRYHLNTVTSGDSSNGTPYSTGLTGVPGTHDVTGDPQFAHPTRDLLSWDASLGGAGTLSAALARVQADPTLVKSSLNPYIQAGFAPTNSAFHNAAHDGTDIGAVAYASGGATAYTLTAPGTPKGDVEAASGTFAVQLNGTPGSAVTITFSDGGAHGTFTPPTLTISDSSPYTATYTPRLVGTHAISTTNNGGLTDPSPVNYLGMVQRGSSGTADSGNNAPSFGGQDLYANGTWLPEFKRDCTADAVDPGSAALIALFGSDHLHVDFRKTDGTSGIGLIGIPYNVVPGTQAAKAVTYTVYPSANPPTSANPSDAGPVPIPTGGSFENFYNGAGVPPANDTSGIDQHILIAVRNETTGLVDTLWELETTWTTDGGTTWNAHGGARFDVATGAQRPDDVSTAEAGGMSILLGLVRYDEVKAVQDGIKADLGHAIRVSVPFSDNKYVWPAKHTVNDGADPNAPMGARFRLSSAWYAANASTYTGQARVILDAMRTYGLIVADITGGGYGLGPFVCGTSDDRWDSDATTHGIMALGNIPVTAFEVCRYIPGWTFTGPSSGPAGTPQTFTVARNPVSGPANYDANIYLRVGGAQSDPRWSVPAVEIKDGQASGTAAFTPAVAGTYALDGVTGGQEWYPPAAITFTATVVYHSAKYNVLSSPCAHPPLTAPAPGVGQFTDTVQSEFFNNLNTAIVAGMRVTPGNAYDLAAGYLQSGNRSSTVRMDVYAVAVTLDSAGNPVVPGGAAPLASVTLDQTRAPDAAATAAGLASFSGTSGANPDPNATARDGSSAPYAILWSGTAPTDLLCVVVHKTDVTTATFAIADTFLLRSPQAIPSSAPTFSWAVHPGREAIRGYAVDILGNDLDLSAVDEDDLPAFTVDGSPHAYDSSIWCKTQTAGPYGPWWQANFGTIGAPAPLPTAAVVAVATSAGWATTTSGAVAAQSAVPVPWAVRSTLPAVRGGGPMELWWNFGDPPSYQDTFPFAANLARNTDFWSGSGLAAIDPATGVPSRLTGGGSFASSPVLLTGANNLGNTPELSFVMPAQAGTFTLRWDTTSLLTPFLNFGGDGTPAGGTTVSTGPTTVVNGKNQAIITYSQDYAVRYSPQVFVQVNGPGGDGTGPVFTGLEIYDSGADPTKVWHTRHKDTFALTRAKGVRWMTTVNNAGFGGSGIIDPSDLTPPTLVGDGTPTLYTGGAITKIEPYTDPGPGQAFDNAHAVFKVTFAAPHHLSSSVDLATQYPGRTLQIAISGGTGGPGGDTTFGVNSGVGGDYIAPSGATGPWVPIDATTAYTGIGMHSGSVTTPQSTVDGTYTPPGGQTWTATGQVQGGPTSARVAAWYREMPSVHGFWRNLPIMGRDPTIEALADSDAALMPAGTEVLLECGNEHAFNNFTKYYCDIQAGRLGLLDGDQFYVIRSGHLRDVYLARWVAAGRSAADVKLVLGSAAGSTGVTDSLCRYATTNVPPVPFEYLATAPYPGNQSFGVGPDSIGLEAGYTATYDAMTTRQMLCLVESNYRWGKFVENGVLAHGAIIARYPALAAVQQVIYESGANVLVPPGSTFDLQARSSAVALDPGYYWAHRYFFQTCSDAGVKKLCYFEFSSANENVAGLLWNTFYGYNMVPGKGDGSDGQYDNRTDPQALDRIVSVVGQVFADWNAASAGGGGRRGRWLGDAGFLGE